MPHTKLKVFSILLILYGVGNILSALTVLLANLLVGERFILALESFMGLNDSMAVMVIVIAQALYLLLAIPDLMAGINGLRLAGGTTDIKFCKIPIIVLFVVYGIRAVLNVFTWHPRKIVQSLVHIAFAAWCLKYAKQADEAYRNLPQPENNPLPCMDEDKQHQ